MDEKERKIISYLRKDARTSLSSLSNEITMPISTIYDKVNRFHRKQIIKKYTILLDFSKLGYHHHVKMALKVEAGQRKELLQFLQQHPAVNSLFEINSGFSFLIEVVHPSIKEHLDFREELKKFNILEQHEYIIVKEVEREKMV